MCEYKKMVRGNSEKFEWNMDSSSLHNILIYFFLLIDLKIYVKQIKILLDIVKASLLEEFKLFNFYDISYHFF